MEDQRIIDLWIRSLGANPQAVALVGPDGVGVTREALERRAESLAGKLRGAGVRRGEIALISLPNGVDWMATFLACLKTETVAVFLDHGMSSAEIDRIAQRLRAKLAWDSERFECNDEPNTRRFRRSGVVLGKVTSGSTGDPKCLFFRDSEMIADGRRTLGGFGMRPDDLILGVIPWGHSYGLGAVVMPFLIQGCRICWMNGALPAEIEAVFKRMSPTFFPCVPTLIRALAMSDCDPEAFRSLRVLITAGSRLDPEVAKAFFARYAILAKGLYGSSETGSIACDSDGRLTLEGSSVGRVMEGVVVRRGRDGRLRVGSSAVYTYGNRMRDSAGTGWCRLGDLGWVDDDEKVRIVSRAKGFVKVGEKRIGLADVERRLGALPGVSAAHAMSLGAAGGQVLGAVIESLEDRSAIARAIREGLPAKHRPRIWKVVTEMPRTSRGKVAEGELRSLLESELRERSNPGT